MSDAVVAAGSYLQVNTGGGYVTVAEVKDIHGPGLKVAPLKVTHLLSPSVAEEKLPGFIDAGQVVVQANYTKAQYAILFALLAARTTALWKIVTSGASVWIASGFLVDLADEIPLEATIEMPFTIEVTGLPTFSA